MWVVYRTNQVGIVKDGRYFMSIYRSYWHGRINKFGRLLSATKYDTKEAAELAVTEAQSCSENKYEVFHIERLQEYPA